MSGNLLFLLGKCSELRALAQCLRIFPRGFYGHLRIVSKQCNLVVQLKDCLISNPGTENNGFFYRPNGITIIFIIILSQKMKKGQNPGHIQKNLSGHLPMSKQQFFSCCDVLLVGA